MLTDLKYIVRGGRLKPKIKTLADILRLTPVLVAKSGRLKPGGALLGKSNLVEKFANHVGKKLNPKFNYRLLVAHADNIIDGKKLETLMLNNNKNIKKLSTRTWRWFRLSRWSRSLNSRGSKTR